MNEAVLPKRAPVDDSDREENGFSFRASGGTWNMQAMRQGSFVANFKEESPSAVRVVLTQMDGSGPAARLSWGEVLHALDAEGKSFSMLRQLLSDIMRDMPFESFYWECPPVSLATLDRPFEFMVIDAPHLARFAPNQGPFSEYLDELTGQEIVRSFLSFTKESLLMAPAQSIADASVFTHIASFFRGAPAKQQDAMWCCLGEALRDRLNAVGTTTNVWVSTEGSGVHWLHFRMDARPKYYEWRQYRDPYFGLKV